MDPSFREEMLARIEVIPISLASSMSRRAKDLPIPIPWHSGRMKMVISAAREKAGIGWWGRRSPKPRTLPLGPLAAKTG